ncbi:MAG: type II toxin-antitoxin system HicA family toxin [Dehalococcoidales bacterium]|nr:type II toxin-antitoxin system HicA family toxin [Dehalococcoidales bacterium]
MPRLPAISGRKAVDAFERAGWQVSRREGSHIILTKAEVPTILSVPDHREVRRGTLRSLIRKAGLSVEEFIVLIRD